MYKAVISTLYLREQDISSIIISIFAYSNLLVEKSLNQFYNRFSKIN